MKYCSNSKEEQKLSLSMASSSSSSSTTTTTTTTTSNMVNNGPALPRARFNWIFPLEKFSATPSMKNNMSAEEELSQRQQAAVFIHELGNHLKVPHFCVNTAVVYMHRFYMINSFQPTNRHRVCAAALFLACKVEEVPRPLRDVIENTGKVLRKKNSEELTKELIAKFAEDIVQHENILLSTLGFSLMVDHPHPIIIKTIQTLGSQIQSLPEKTPRELAQTAYYLATKSILFTPFCVKYPPDLIACFCIHLAAAWLKIEMPSPASNTNSETTEPNNKRWFHLVNESFTEKQLGDLADEFLAIYEKCPDRIKRKLAYQSERQPQSTNAQDGISSSSSSTTTTTTTSSSYPPTTSRPTELADSVVPQGASREKHEHRQSHAIATNPPPIPSNRPPLPTHAAPPLPPPPSSGAIKREQLPPPPLPSAGPIKRDPAHPSGAIKRESSASAPPPNPSFSSNSRSSHPPPPPSMGQSRSSSHYPHPPSHYPPSQPPPQPSSHHHMNNNYNPHSRYPSQQAPPRPPPPPPPQQQQQHNMDRKGPPPPPPSSNRPPYNNPPRNSHYNNVPPPSNPYPNQGHYGGHPHPPSLMNVGGEKRSYDGNYDPNNKRPRSGPPSSSSSSSQQWNNK